MNEKFNRFLKALHSYETLNSFVLRGELRCVLEHMTGIHITAAKECLDNAKLAINFNHQLLLAAGHLQTARLAAIEQWKDGGSLRYTQPFEYQYAISEYARITLMLAGTYVSLKENALAKKALDDAEIHINAANQFFTFNTRKAIAALPGTIANGVTRFGKLAKESFDRGQLEYDRRFFEHYGDHAQTIRRLCDPSFDWLSRWRIR